MNKGISDITHILWNDYINGDDPNDSMISILADWMAKRAVALLAEIDRLLTEREKLLEWEREGKRHV